MLIYFTTVKISGSQPFIRQNKNAISLWLGTYFMYFYLQDGTPKEKVENPWSSFIHHSHFPPNLSGRSNAGKLGLLSISILRLGLIPLFMFCNAAPQTRHNLPILFNSDTVRLNLLISQGCPTCGPFKDFLRPTGRVNLVV